MSEATKIVLTSSATILGGVIVFCLQQIVSEVFIVPILNQRKLFGEIKIALKYYANIYSNPGVTSKETISAAQERFRELASNLDASVVMIPAYKLLSKIRFVVPANNIAEASKNFIFLSNSCWRIPGEVGVSNSGFENSKKAEEIEKLLKFLT